MKTKRSLVKGSFHSHGLRFWNDNKEMFTKVANENIYIQLVWYQTPYNIFNLLKNSYRESRPQEWKRHFRKRLHVVCIFSLVPWTNSTLFCCAHACALRSAKRLVICMRHLFQCSALVATLQSIDRRLKAHKINKCMHIVPLLEVIELIHTWILKYAKIQIAIIKLEDLSHSLL